jgi:hypothetical protein
MPVEKQEEGVRFSVLLENHLVLGNPLRTGPLQDPVQICRGHALE